MLMAQIIGAIVFVVDLYIKSYLYLNLSGQSIPIIKNILYITVIENSGAAFGILKGKTQFLIYVGIFFIFLFFLLMKKEVKKNLLVLVSCGLILGGAFSNLYDRVVFGFVIDYIDIRIWPVFNLSDSCISIGVGLLLIDSFKESRLKKKK